MDIFLTIDCKKSTFFGLCFGLGPTKSSFTRFKIKEPYPNTKTDPELFNESLSPGQFFSTKF